MLYLIRHIVLFFWGILASILGVLISLCRPFHPDNSYLFSKIFAPIAGKILGLHYQVINPERLSLHRPAIFVSNHQHNLDLLTGCTVIQPHMVSLGKKDIKFIPLFGQFYWLAGNVLIDRFNRGRAMSSMDKVKKEVVKKGISIWIMPEGTRNKNNVLKKFKKGAFLTAIHCQVPLIPVAISSYKININYNRWKAGTILLEVLPPIMTTGLNPQDAQKMSEEVKSLIESKIKSLDLLILHSDKKV